MQEDEEIIREFLVESHENLSRLDSDMVDLESRPDDTELLASVFRTMHTIKGTCGFLGFSVLERIAHRAESLLVLLRDGRLQLTPPLVSLILAAVDATRSVLARIEATGEQGSEQFDELVGRLQLAATEGLSHSAGEEQAAGSLEAPSSPPPEPTKRDDGAGKPSPATDANIRVDVGLLDKLMDLVGELVLARNQILQIASGREDQLSAISKRLNLITTELQESAMKTRMQPIGIVWNKLPRMVRDLSLSLGKQVRLELEGADTELDRTIVESIKDPLMHLVRNACDHGIEAPDARQRAGKAQQGVLTLRAWHEGGQVNIEVADDGAGIDADRVRQKAVDQGLLAAEMAQKISDREAFDFIFTPGFSTAAAVTNVSGRGVGMDVVRTQVEHIGGTVDVSSRPGRGTTIRIRIPLTLAIIPGLVVSSGHDRFVIPQAGLLELIRLESDSPEKRIEHVNGTPVYRRRGRLLPISYLNSVLGRPATDRSDGAGIVVLQAEDQQFGLVVDAIMDTQEIVVKPLSKQFKGLTLYAGATILGDGNVALILDVSGIGRYAGVLGEAMEQVRCAAEPPETAQADHQRLLLFRAGSFQRIAVPLSLVARLEELPLSSIERSGWGPVMQYRGSILPLASLAAVLDSGSEEMPPGDPVQVVVFSDGQRSLGLLVDQILDISEDAVDIRQRSKRPGFLGSGVVGGRIADFLDLEYLLQTLGAHRRPRGERPAVVLLADPSGVTRGLLRNRLDLAGYSVREASNLEETVQRLERDTVDLVAAANHLPPAGSSGLRALMRDRAAWKDIPVVLLNGMGGDIEEEIAEALRRKGGVSGAAGASIETPAPALLPLWEPAGERA